MLKEVPLPLRVSFALGVLAVAAGCSSVSDAKEPTPEPGSLRASSLSICIRELEKGACVSEPINPDKKNQFLAGLFNLTSKLNQEISPNSKNIINLSIQNIFNELNKDRGIPISISFALQEEAGGGSSWSFQNRNDLKQSSKIGDLMAELKPSIEIFLPKIKMQENGQPIIISTKDIEDLIIWYHELIHTNESIERFYRSGTFIATEEEKVFIDSPYKTPQTKAEEYLAEFYSDVVGIALAKQYGLDNPELHEENIALDGKSLPSIAYWLDQHGVGPENAIWQVIYDTNTFFWWKNQFNKDGDEQAREVFQFLLDLWNNYSWTEEEKLLLEQMQVDGEAEGWLIPNCFPPIPEIKPQTNLEGNPVISTNHENSENQKVLLPPIGTIVVNLPSGMYSLSPQHYLTI